MLHVQAATIFQEPVTRPHLRRTQEVRGRGVGTMKCLREFQRELHQQARPQLLVGKAQREVDITYLAKKCHQEEEFYPLARRI